MSVQTEKKATVYGIFNGKTFTRFVGVDSLTGLGKRFLYRKFKEENIKWNKEGILEYLQSWCDWSQDMDEPCNDPELMIEQAVDTLVYSNVHFMNVQTRCQISGDDRKIVEQEILRILSLPF